MGAQNMQVLVDDLLTYSKVNTEDHHPSLFNLVNLLEIIQHELGSSITESQSQINCQNIPTLIYGDKTKIRQLFQNLISNAIKFRKKEIESIIDIKSTEDEHFWYFSVTDNGIGIKPEFHEKIFEIFRKLHSANEYEGSGIGLSLCAKIVEQHSGEISIDSKLGVYTRFDFSLRKN